MAQVSLVSQVRTVNAASYKSSGRKPSRQQTHDKEPSENSEQSETATAPPDDDHAPPHIDEFV